MNYKYKVLIIDHDEEVLSVIKKQLETDGFKVLTSQSTTEAYEKVKNNKYHIVLINIEMPQMDGIKLLKEIKKYDPMTQIIMLTEASTMEKILNSLEYGANDYIYKPLRSEEYVMNVIECSVQKLERWREAVMQLIK